jgi:hypothetical protein
MTFRAGAAASFQTGDDTMSRRTLLFIIFCCCTSVLSFAVFSVSPAAGGTSVSSPHPSTDTGLLKIDYPLDDTMFPIDMAAPVFRWTDREPASKWRLEFKFADDLPPLKILCDLNRWKPENKAWSDIKRRSLEKAAELVIISLDSGGREIQNRRAAIRWKTSSDPVGAPIFYRDVQLPFRTAFMKINEIEWKLGRVSSGKPPRTILTNLMACANCHSFPSDGSILAMDVDYGNDKGSYIISPIGKEVHLNPEEIISWTDYSPGDTDKTFGLLSQISPDGRYVISTVRDRPVQLPTTGIEYSQLFFPIKGILVVYDRQTRKMVSLPGADSPEFVQTNPAWSPDGKWIVFARAAADDCVDVRGKYIENRTKFRYDLYRIPFNAGRGGTAAPLEGASFNGKSNFFPRYTPDGKWIVFCQADSYMLLQADSLLYRVPAEGGSPKLMRCNRNGNMNSWHSISPNGRWLVFASKAGGPYTQMWLTHIDPMGNDNPPVLLENFISEKRAANIPEFVNIPEGKMQAIHQHIFKNKEDGQTGKKNKS